MSPEEKNRILKSMCHSEIEEIRMGLKLMYSSRIILPATRYNILKRQLWRCNSCGEHLKYSKHHTYGVSVAHIDHIHPYSERLTYINGIENINEESNLQALCEKCNKIKYLKKD